MLKTLSLIIQVQDFANEVVGNPVFLVCNSVGGVAGLQAGVDAPEQVISRFKRTRRTRLQVLAQPYR